MTSPVWTNLLHKGGAQATMPFFDHSDIIMPGLDVKAGAIGLDETTVSPYNMLYSDLKKRVLQSFLTAKEATIMRGVSRESFAFFGTEHEKRLRALGVQDEHIASIDPSTPTAIRIVTHQLEELKKNSPSSFKKFKQNYLDTGISCPAAFSLVFDERTIMEPKLQILSQQAAECNNFTLVKYLADKQRARITLVQNEGLARACGTGNLSMVQWMLDPVNVVMGRPGKTTSYPPTRMIIISKNFSLMKWIMEQTIAEKSPQTVVVAKKIPLDPDAIVDAAILGGKEFYENMAAFVRNHQDKLPEMAALLPVADYYSGIVNDQKSDDFGWISNLDDPRLMDGINLTLALYCRNNVQLVLNFFNKAVSNSNQGIVLKEPFTNKPQIFLILALMAGCDLDILTMTYQKLREEQRLLYIEEGQWSEEEIEQALEIQFPHKIEKMCMSGLITHGQNPHLLPAQLKALHIKPTILHVVEALEKKAYATAKMLTSDLMAENKVQVTRKSLQGGFERLNFTKPSDEILAKLFNLPSAALDLDRARDLSPVRSGGW